MSATPHNFEFRHFPAKEDSRLVVSYCVNCGQMIAASPRLENLFFVEDLHHKHDEEGDEDGF